MGCRSKTSADTTTASDAAGRMGVCFTVWMAGPALPTFRLLTRPGEPSFLGSAMRPYASVALPCRRSKISGCPRSHFTFARSETLVAFGGIALANGAERMRFD